jgi:antitoxin PrlF
LWREEGEAKIICDTGRPVVANLASGKTVRYLTGMSKSSRRQPSRQSAAFSRVSVKSQTVLPRAVRDRLGIRPGDTVRYRLTEAGVMIDKSPAGEADDPFASFSEWAGAADEKAYGGL